MATRRGAVLCECHGSLMDPDALEAADRRRCLDCGRQAPELRWRCDECQRTVDNRAARAAQILERNRRTTSHTTPL